MNYDRIILELMDRVATLEDEVQHLKETTNLPTSQPTKSNTSKDTTKYILDGKRYPKNRLVLAIIQKYMILHPNTSADALIQTFDKSLQGSLGVIRTLEDAKLHCSDYKTRFFASEAQWIHTTTETCVVCTQWGIANIGNILIRASQLGIKVQAIK